MENLKFKILISRLFTFIFLVIIFLPLVVSAETPLPSPIGGGKGMEDVVGNIIKVVLGLVGVLALIFFIYGGIMWMTSAGNMEKVKKGKSAMVWASLGLVVCFLAYALVNYIILRTGELGGQN